jgi:hypothetical protein
MNKLKALRALKAPELSKADAQRKAACEWLAGLCAENGLVAVVSPAPSLCPGGGGPEYVAAAVQDALFPEMISLVAQIKKAVIAGIEVEPTSPMRVCAWFKDSDAARVKIADVKATLAIVAAGNLRDSLHRRLPLKVRVRMTHVSIETCEGVDSFVIKSRGFEGVYPCWTPINEIADLLIQQTERQNTVAASRAALDLLEDM